jgi:hypothetical protein
MDANFLFEALADPESFYWNCDICNTNQYTEANPFVEVRTPRPSDPSDMCCILAGHLDCFGGQVGETVNTPDGWADWIESEDAARQGYMWLT